MENPSPYSSSERTPAALLGPFFSGACTGRVSLRKLLKSEPAVPSSTSVPSSVPPLTSSRRNDPSGQKSVKLPVLRPSRPVRPRRLRLRARRRRRRLSSQLPLQRDREPKSASRAPRVLQQSPPPELVKIDKINGCALRGVGSRFSFSIFLLLCNFCSLLTIHGFVGFFSFGHGALFEMWDTRTDTWVGGRHAG